METGNAKQKTENRKNSKRTTDILTTENKNGKPKTEEKENQKYKTENNK